MDLGFHENPHWVSELIIEGLWDSRDLDITFTQSTNILIGPNGSGKTTILNLLHYALNVNLKGLSQIQFRKVTIRLQAFSSKEHHSEIVIIPSQDGYLYAVGGEETLVTLEPHRALGRLLAVDRFRMSAVARTLQQRLGELVPSVWLSVSRRLPITEEEEIRGAIETQRGLETVDHRLSHLVEQLSKYRGRLDTYLARRYKEFERKVLQEMLYSKEYDTLAALSSLPSEEERQRLIDAFKTVGLLDSKVERRIAEHFAAAEGAVARLSGKRTKNALPGTVEDLLVLPLIRRTNALVQYARNLDQQREEIFEPLNRFQKNVNTFFERKRLSVQDDGSVLLRSTLQQKQTFTPSQLSSGEKQLLILLAEALLREDAPVVYVADEPELSLHVTWQARLLPALLDVGGKMQLLVATHSPDIVGPFTNCVIELRPI